MIATIVETITIFVLRMLTSFANSLFYTGHVIFFYRHTPILDKWSSTNRSSHLSDLDIWDIYCHWSVGCSASCKYISLNIYLKKYYVGLYIVYIV